MKINIPANSQNVSVFFFFCDAFVNIAQVAEQKKEERERKRENNAIREIQKGYVSARNLQCTVLRNRLHAFPPVRWEKTYFPRVY